jgi:hypothetical protein
MRKIILTVLTSTAISLVGIASLQAAPINGAGIGGASNSTISKAYYYGYHPRYVYNPHGRRGGRRH